MNIENENKGNLELHKSLDDFNLFQMYANCNWASNPSPLLEKRGLGIEAQLLFLFDIEAILLTHFVIEMFKKNNFCNF